MAKNPLVITRSVNGWAGSLKEGPADSFFYSRHLDFRKDPNLLTILPATVKESSTTVTGLVTDMVQLPSGLMVAIDSSGGVYTRSTSGVWAKNGTTLTSTAYGMVYNLQQDTIYIPGQTTIHSITNADGRFGGSFTVNEGAIAAIQDQSGGTAANTYTTTGSITETAVNKLSVIPTLDPMYSVKIYVTTKGSGDLTVTMHDAANNTLATKTLLNAAITNGQLNEFVFAAPTRVLARPNAATYHFHVTHPNGTAHTIGTTTASDLSTANYATLSNRLVQPVNGFHPVYEFLQYYLILNERYVAQWEPISQSAPSALEFVQHRLVLPSGYEATSGCAIDEYFVIAAEKRSSSTTTEHQKGKLFIWDGFSPTYNRVIDCPEGAPYGIYAQSNIAYYFANGKLWAWSTGNPVPTFQMPGTDSEYTDASLYMVNYPHTMAVRNSILLGAFPSETNSQTMEHAVYSWGQRNKNYDHSFGYSYSMSDLSRVNGGSGTLRLGMVKSHGDKLFISWRDGSTYGVDKVSPTSDPFVEATWESLLFDNGRADKQKEAVKLEITYKSLPTGCTVTPKYKIDRAANWTSGTAGTAGSTSAKVNINKRYREIQIGFDLVATDTTPEIISRSLIWESLATEKD